MKKIGYLWLIFLCLSFTSKVFSSNPEWIINTLDSLGIRYLDNDWDNAVHQLEVDKNDRIWTVWRKVAAMYDYPNSVIIGKYAKVDDTTSEYFFGILNMAVNFQNSIWFSKPGGLVKFTPWVETVHILIKNIPRRTLSTIVSYNGYLWISVPGVGILRYDWTNYTVYNKESGSLPDNFLSIEAIDISSVFWLFDGSNLFTWDGNSWTYLDSTNSPFPGPPNEIYPVNIFVDPNNNKWICYDSTWSDFTPKIYKYDGVTWTLYNISNVPEVRGLGVASHVAFDSRGNKWITVAGSSSPVGLIKFDDSTWTVFTMLNSGFPHFDGGTVKVDSKDNVWVSTRVGLVVYREGGVLFNSVDEGIHPLQNC